MAKITPSALITEIKGKWHADTFQMWKGSIIVRRTTPPTQHPKASKARYRGLVSDIAGKYDALSDAQKTGWACYAELLPVVMSGFNAFLRNNTVLVYPDHPGLCFISDAPTTYAPPTTPHPLSVDYLSATDEFCVYWTSPVLASYYTQVYYSPQTGYNDTNYAKFSQAGTVPAAQKYFSMSANPYPSGTIVRFRARNVHVLGEVSAWTDTKSATKT